MKKLTHEQIARMTPEVREKYEKKVKQVKRNRRILAGFIAGLIAIAIVLALSMTVLFNITSISVTKCGNFYKNNEIISASGLDVGDNMLRTDFKAAAHRIEEMLPYVLEAKITKSASGKVTISVTDDKASIIFRAENGYAVADAHSKVLEVLHEQPENSNLIVLKTSKSVNAVPGEVISFSDEKESQLYAKLIEALKNAELYEKLSGIDISKHGNIKVEYQHRMRIRLGDMSDLDVKLAGVVKTIEKEDMNNPNMIAEINAVTPKKVYVNSLDTLEEKDETENKNEKPDTEAPENGDENSTEAEPANAPEETSQANAESDPEGENGTDGEGATRPAQEQ